METKYKVLISIFITIAMVLGAVIGQINYGYEVDKCNNLRTSNYDFNVKLEVDASYSSDCYSTTHHPLAEIGFILRGLVMGFLISVFICFIVGLIIFLVKEERELKSSSYW